tara:strand:+ start:105993 stop:106688 length:696 start_codon:yes stop_codon:yes gene_type:complete
MILSSVSNTADAIDGTKSGNASEDLQDDLNRFLNLLVTQLKNQDPLDPMDSNEFTSQLVQFASVEQQIYQNSNLEKMLAVQENNQISSMVNFIDKTIEVDSQSIPLEDGQAVFTYTMPAGAKSANIIIRDSAGLTVYEQDANLDQGQHTFEWDGRNKSGQTVADGEYLAVVTGLSNQSELLQITQTAFGRVTGIGIENGNTSLFMGDIEVPQTNVISVKESPKAAETPTVN